MFFKTHIIRQIINTRWRLDVAWISLRRTDRETVAVRMNVLCKINGIFLEHAVCWRRRNSVGKSFNSWTS